MDEPNWLESRKKKNLRYYLVISSIVAAAGFLFFYNNREVFFKQPKHRQAMPDVRSAPMHTASIPDASAAMMRRNAAVVEKASVASNRAVEKSSQAKRERKPSQNVSPASAATTAYDTVRLDDVPCTLRGREAMKVTLSVELLVASGPFEKEVLLKRENCKVMVQKVFSEKTLDELIVDSLRIQTKAAMNRILEGGSIIGVQFRNFRIEKVL